MEQRHDDPRYRMHEPPQPAGDAERRLSAEEYRERSVEAENTGEAVNIRENMGMPAPSRVRESEAEHTHPDE